MSDHNQRSRADTFVKWALHRLDDLIDKSDVALMKITPESIEGVQQHKERCIQCEAEKLSSRRPRMSRARASIQRRSLNCTKPLDGASVEKCSLPGQLKVEGAVLKQENGVLVPVQSSYNLLTTVYCMAVLVPLNILVCGLKILHRMTNQLYRGPRPRHLVPQLSTPSSTRRFVSPKKRLPRKSLFSKLNEWFWTFCQKRPVSRFKLTESEEINKSPNKSAKEAQKRKRHQVEEEDEELDSEGDDVNYGNFNFDDYNSEDDTNFEPESDCSEDSLEYRSRSDDSLEEPLCALHRRLEEDVEVLSPLGLQAHYEKCDDLVPVDPDKHGSGDEGQVHSTQQEDQEILNPDTTKSDDLDVVDDGSTEDKHSRTNSDNNHSPRID